MMKKRMIATLTIVLLLFAAALPAAAADTIFDSVTEQTLIKGLTYKRIQRLTTNGWQDIHIVEADMSEPHLKFKVLTDPKGVSHMSNVLKLAQEHDTLAAVNGDFFSRKSGTSNRGSAVGIEIIDGELVSTTATEPGMNALYQLEDGSFAFNLFSFDITVTAPNGNTEKIRHINKFDDLTGIVMYTRAWNNLTLDAEYNMAHIIVKDDIVQEIRGGEPPAEIPENGYVLTCLRDYNMFLPDNFQVGDPIKLDITTTPDFNKIEQAVGGGAYLLIDGQVPSSFSHNITGYNPRTAIGVDKSGNKLVLAAVDGRQALAKGMTQTEMGYLMAELGCYTALNLDGGGSTTMAIAQDGEQQVVNSPSDGSLRNVANGIGITADTAEPVLTAVRMNADDTRVFNGTSRWIWLEGIDQYGRVMDIPQAEVAWTIEGVDGSIRDNCYYPDGTGEAVITGRYGDFHDVLRLDVLDVPYSMGFSSRDMSLSQGESATLYLYARDKDGFQAMVYPNNVKMEIEGSFAAMEGNNVVGKAAGSGLVSASLGDTRAYMALHVDSSDSVNIPDDVGLSDPANRSAELTGGDNSFRFTVFGKDRAISKLYDVHVIAAAQRAMAKDGEKHAFIGNYTSDYMTAPFGDDAFTAHSYNRFVHKGSTFITINNRTGDIFGSDAGQWTKFGNDIAAVDGNLFVFIDNDGISSNEVENERFCALLEDAAARGANVFVFGGSWGNFSTVQNGVRYISTAGIFDTVGLRGPADIYNVKYYTVTVNGSDVSYELKSIL